MRIACLAWGSLIWKAEPLVLASPWRAGGASLPIEFARVGDEGELATVICDAAAPVPTRWALLEADGVGIARELLRRREGIDESQPDCIGSVPWLPGQPAPRHGETVAAWARAQRVGAVVWTALPPRFAGHNGRAPSVDEAVAYLGGLPAKVREHAEHYVRHVPAEIRTPYRAAFEARFGWRPAAV